MTSSHRHLKSTVIIDALCQFYAIQRYSQGVVARTCRELERVAEVGRRENEDEVARLQSEFAQEVPAMQQVQRRQRTRVELDVGGVRHDVVVTSVATLRKRPGSMLDAINVQRVLQHRRG